MIKHYFHPRRMLEENLPIFVQLEI